MHAALVLDGSPTAMPRRARRWVQARCADSGIDDIGADLALVVSELVTNAGVHGSPPVSIRVDIDDERIRVEVRDSSEHMPEVCHPSPSSVGGRGLLIVESVSRSWGAHAVPGGKVVWAELAAGPAAATAPGTGR